MNLYFFAQKWHIRLMLMLTARRRKDKAFSKSEHCYPRYIANGETREGWPLLTVKTEIRGESWSTNDRGPSLVG
jgi:hypothetical protein